MNQTRWMIARALMAMGLMVGFYAVALALAAGLVVRWVSISGATRARGWGLSGSTLAPSHSRPPHQCRAAESHHLTLADRFRDPAAPIGTCRGHAR
jgi:hypothetical protein